MTDAPAPTHVHLVGSIGLDTVDDVFRTVGTLLSPYLRRVPDGEVGGRKLWISWQYPLLRASAFLRPDPSGAVRPTNRFPLLTLAEGVRPQDVRFGELGYAREARASYLDFTAARERGELPRHVRFQVALPTPFAVVSSVVVADALAAVEAAYEQAMIAEVAALCRHIPHRDLTIQWDLCNEMIVWDGQKTGGVPHADVPPESFLPRIQRLCAAIPDDVEIGLHLCYGDFAGKHFVEPKDASRMVAFANALAALFGACPDRKTGSHFSGTRAAIAHPLAYIHMPVPIERSDDDFHRPWRDLKLPPETELYLGVVHATDGTRARIAAARKYAPAFGIATECGMARARSEETVRRLLQIHAEVCGAG
jgi:methionine synthase II (cobalamin-independent)